MLDFLPDEIRKVLLGYPIIVDFLNGEMEEKLFLEDLKAFRSELISKLKSSTQSMTGRSA